MVSANVPGYVPWLVLLGLEAVAVFVWVAVDRRRSDEAGAAALCSRCARLREQTEALARVADAAAVGALAFLVALPFVAAGYEGGFTISHAVLATSAVAAALAVAAEANFLARAAAKRLWPHLRWRAQPSRIVGGGARWLGLLLVLYIFQPRDAGIAALLGGVGERLVVARVSAWPIFAAAAVLAAAFIVALAARRLAPIVFASLAPTRAAARGSHGAAR